VIVTTVKTKMTRFRINFGSSNTTGKGPESSGSRVRPLGGPRDRMATLGSRPAPYAAQPPWLPGPVRRLGRPAYMTW